MCFAYYLNFNVNTFFFLIQKYLLNYFCCLYCLHTCIVLKTSALSKVHFLNMYYLTNFTRSKCKTNISTKNCFFFSQMLNVVVVKFWIKATKFKIQNKLLQIIFFFLSYNFSKLNECTMKFLNIFSSNSQLENVEELIVLHHYLLSLK